MFTGAFPLCSRVLTGVAGEYEKVCEVNIVNDTRYEEEEMFRLVLGSPHSQTLGRAAVGKRNVTQIIIKDDGDSKS